MSRKCWDYFRWPGISLFLYIEEVHVHCQSPLWQTSLIQPPLTQTVYSRYLAQEAPTVHISTLVVPCSQYDRKLPLCLPKASRVYCSRLSCQRLLALCQLDERLFVRVNYTTVLYICDNINLWAQVINKFQRKKHESDFPAVSSTKCFPRFRITESNCRKLDQQLKHT